MNQQVNWVNDFEKEFRLKFFGNPTAESTEEKNVVYFENTRNTEWAVKIDQNIKVITIGKLKSNNFEIGEREKQMIDFLLSHSKKWYEIGLKESNNTIEVKNITNKLFQIEVKYGEKEKPNVFGNYDWSEF
ncbi:TPA: hypothetical protein LLD95_000311 [Enterococcus faecium]|nr:hypothetical protein [Enterococcus faecium]HBH6478215.1 hypothetical protein [Enterococcus faecium]HBK5863280.1 hypothetical protein [Enterococcus faecium]